MVSAFNTVWPSMSAGSVGLLESRTPSAMQGLGYSAGSEPASRTTHHTPIEIGIEKIPLLVSPAGPIGFEQGF